MRTHSFGALAAILLAPAGAWTPSDAPLTLQPESRLWVEGTSTMRSFTCKAVVLEADVGAEAGAVGAVLAGEKAVKSVEVRVPAKRLDCGNGTMNAHMYKALKAEQHDAITFRVASYEVGRAGEGVRGTLTGTLTLGGVQRPITVTATGRGGADGVLRVAGIHELKMSEYGLKPPSLMMGTMKVGDVVKVGFDLVLKGEPKVATSE
ncbi:MAG: YceI family protein [Gemmatirosa sp.]